MNARRGCLSAGLIGTAWAVAACQDRLDLGSDVVWSTDFEHGDLAAWQAPPGTGGAYNEGAGPSDASVVVSTEQAHSGRFAAKFTSLAAFSNPTAQNGSGLFKEGPFPEAAYYSAWYFVPEYHQTISGWNILKIQVPVDVVVPNDGDAGAEAAAPDATLGAATDASVGTASARELLNLSLQSLPPNQKQLALVLSDVRPNHLTSPIPAQIPFVPIGQWFQVECYYKNLPTSDGELTVWLNGVQAYDVVRAMSSNQWVHFMPCSFADDLDPPEAVLYVDDVAVSWRRVTPRGVLTVAP